MTSDAEALLRSVRARIAQIPGVTEVERKGEIGLVHSGAELARLQARTPPRLVFPDGASEEITGLPQAAAAADKVRALAAARAARVPQLSLFK